MKVLVWNIRHGGGRRLRRIADALKQHTPDTVVITEYQPGPGAFLCSRLQEQGLSHIAATAPAPKLNGVLIASRVPFRPRSPSASGGELDDRWLEVEFPKKRFTLAGVYLPTQRVPLIRAWERMHEAAERRRADHFLFVGDLNSGHTPLDAENGRFTCDKYFSAMPLRGFTDVWRHRHRGRLEYTWYSNPSGGQRSGFRIDHVFASSPMLRRVVQCEYSHQERKLGLSDHSALLLAIR